MHLPEAQILRVQCRQVHAPPPTKTAPAPPKTEGKARTPITFRPLHPLTAHPLAGRPDAGRPACPHAPGRSGMDGWPRLGSDTGRDALALALILIIAVAGTAPAKPSRIHCLLSSPAPLRRARGLLSQLLLARHEAVGFRMRWPGQQRPRRWLPGRSGSPPDFHSLTHSLTHSPVAPTGRAVVRLAVPGPEMDPVQVQMQRLHASSPPLGHDPFVLRPRAPPAPFPGFPLPGRLLVWHLFDLPRPSGAPYVYSRPSIQLLSSLLADTTSSPNTPLVHHETIAPLAPDPESITAVPP